MQTRIYRAYSMAEALAAVRRELGADAVILTTRSFKRGGFLGLWRKNVFEVTAVRNEGQRSPRAAGQSRGTNHVLAGRAYAAAGKGRRTANATVDGAAARDASQPRDQQRTRQLALEMLKEIEQRRKGNAILDQVNVGDAQRQSDNAMGDNFSRSTVHARAASAALKLDEEPHGVPDSSPAVAVVEEVPAPERKSAAAVSTVARRFVIADPQRSHELGSTHVAEADIESDAVSQPEVMPRAAVAAVPSADAGFGDGMRKELAALREMVAQVLRRQGAAESDPPPGVPDTLFDMYLHMISQDLSEELADQIITAVRDELDDDALEDRAAVRRTALKHLAQHIPVAECPVPLESPDDRPLTIALIGPTGVGKTTTLAKLAASFKLRHEKKVGLITCDTYRIAAVDQLRTYANIIGLPLQVVLMPSDMKQAIHALRECDVILIDTAGRGQKDTNRLAELRAFLAEADPHEVHLVLSGTASEKVLMQEAEAFGKVGVDKVVLTKLDEAVSFGMLVNVIRHIHRDLSFFTTGQEVPDHIEIGRAERLAELMLESAE